MLLVNQLLAFRIPSLDVFWVQFERVVWFTFERLLLLCLWSDPVLLDQITTLIETFHFEWQENSLLLGLKDKLASAGITCNPMSPHEIFEKLNHQHTLGTWAELMTKALQAIRVERSDRATIFSRLKAAKIHNAEKYSELLDLLHEGYVAELKRQNAIDFGIAEDQCTHTVNWSELISTHRCSLPLGSAYLQPLCWSRFGCLCLRLITIV